MSQNEWHVRPSPCDVAIWEVWYDDRIVAQSTMDEAWELAKFEARTAKGQAYLYYRLRNGIRENLDCRES
jgi:hypothetical protein